MADNTGAVRDNKMGDVRNMGATREARNLDIVVRLFQVLREQRSLYEQSASEQI